MLSYFKATLMGCALALPVFASDLAHDDKGANAPASGGKSMRAFLAHGADRLSVADPVKPESEEKKPAKKAEDEAKPHDKHAAGKPADDAPASDDHHVAADGHVGLKEKSPSEPGGDQAGEKPHEDSSPSKKDGNADVVPASEHDEKSAGIAEDHSPTAIEPAEVASHAAPDPNGSGHAETVDAGSHDKPAAHQGEVHWTYEGDGGPENWGDLKEEYATCKIGTAQSPIDVSAGTDSEFRELGASYTSVPLSVLHNGHTVQFNTDGAGAIVLGGVTFKLAQVHFHAPSEHTVDHTHAPLEAHFVHKSDSGALAVVGVFLYPGASNPALEALMLHLPEHETPVATYEDVKINPSDLLPKDQHFTWYLGSLTTPPCSEGVNWHVMRTSIEASKEQIDRMASVMGMNARPVQDVHGRRVASASD